MIKPSFVVPTFAKTGSSSIGIKLYARQIIFGHDVCFTVGCSCADG